MKVIIEINGLFDKEVHLGNADKISRVRKQKQWLLYFGIASFLICLADGIFCFIGFQRYDFKQIVASQFVLGALQSIFLLIWGVTLILLNR